MYFSGINPGKVFCSDLVLFKSFYITSFIRTLYAKLTGRKLRLKRYAGKTVYSHSRANQLIKEHIFEGRPFFFGRHGSTELNIATEALFDQLHIRKMNLETVKNCSNCGFFARNEDDVYAFLNEISFASSKIDMYGTFRMILEDYYILKYMKKNVELTHLNVMDFWRYKEPFTYALKGKKVLVIHPMAKLIEKQYQKRKLLFDNEKVLPEFTLKTLQAVQTIMLNKDDRFDSWFDALDYMYKEAMNIEFDVAILGCGAYGMPLAARLREQGKTVIYMGGVTQMLFGIKGDRWDRDPEASKLYNDNWVRPGKEDKPSYYEKVESGCYW